MRILPLLPLAAWASVALQASAEDLSKEEAEALFEAPAAVQVNEGNLVFLPRLPQRPVHHHQNHVIIDTQSLSDGWVILSQCHVDLDAVARSQILFSRERTKDLSVTAADGVGKVWVEGNTIQLQDTSHGAHVCLRARSRALTPQPDGRFLLKNGPFLRRFLDGFFPMRVSMRVTLDGPHLDLVEIRPERQPGFRVWTDHDEVFYEAQFEGRLTTELYFRYRD